MALLRRSSKVSASSPGPGVRVKVLREADGKTLKARVVATPTCVAAPSCSSKNCPALGKAVNSRRDFRAD